MKSNRMRRALVSVSDKSNIEKFCRALADMDIAIISTGGTAAQLRDAGIGVYEVSDYTGFPEIMDGRVKTLHPKIHGGILARGAEDDAVMREHRIAPIDLVVVNLYPFEKTVATPDCDLSRAIENIDIGGPTLLRAAAKNHARVTVVVDPNDYDECINKLKNNKKDIGADLRFALAKKAFAHCAKYDTAIAAYLATKNDTAADSQFPAELNLQFTKKQDLRYGENPHQTAAFYTDAGGGIAAAKQLQGKELSFNNINDADAALECVHQFAAPACVIVKHMNPCGVAINADQSRAYQRAFATDPESAFGGIIAFNKELKKETATAIIKQQFAEVIIAPAVASAALKVIAEKPNIRVLVAEATASAEMDYKRVSGGLLVQSANTALLEDIKVVTAAKPNAAQLQDLKFAWTVAKFVKSNAIVYAREQATVGIGAGQMSRVNSARLATQKAQAANLETAGAVLASDAFFPFRDGLDNAATDGINAVIQPGGALRDDEVIAAANQHNIAMVFTAMRHFRH